MQNRLDTRLAALRHQGRRAFVAYTVACDPSFDASLARLHAYVDGGVDIIEIGYPSADPILDGATIREAHRRAVAAGGSLARSFDLCAAFRTADTTTPLVLMGYAAPLVAMGYETFAARAAAAGIDGVIVADLPLREAGALLTALSAHPVVMVPLSAPNLPAEDFAARRPGLGGFLYCIPVLGATGGAPASLETIASAVARSRAETTLPLLVGFGIKTPEMAAEVAQIADGAIVATALLDRIAALPEALSAGERRDQTVALVSAYRRAIDAG